jgi:hypothetical protein
VFPCALFDAVLDRFGEEPTSRRCATKSNPWRAFGRSIIAVPSGTPARSAVNAFMDAIGPPDRWMDRTAGVR